MHRLTRVLEATDPELARHGNRTARLAGDVAAEMGMCPQEIARVELAARLHDIGKLFISREILDKPGAPTELEWAELRRHPQIGFELVEGHVPTDVARIVLTHHERYDGSGYPNRVIGTEIPVEARVLQVADAFDAITSVRPYQPALPIAYAVAELQRYSGTQFDPTAVRAIMRLIAKRHRMAPAMLDVELLDDEVAV